MDPTRALQDMRALARWVTQAQDDRYGAVSAYDFASKAVELAEAFQDLDTWLAGGGFTPQQWSYARHETP